MTVNLWNYWWPADGLVALREQVNAMYPERDTASDGVIGDEAHSERVSDHNPDGSSNPPGVVRAWDMDENLSGDRNAAMRIADHLRVEMKEGREKRLKYIIYEGRICSARSNWDWRGHTGDPHLKHVHFSFSDSADHDGSRWSLPGQKPPPPPEKDEDDMKYAEVRSSSSGQQIGTGWSWLDLPIPVRDSDDLHYKGPTFSLSGHRFQFTLTTSVSDEAVLTVQAVILDGEQEASTTGQVSAGAPEKAPGFVVSGYCPQGKRVRLRVKATKPVTLKATAVLFAWR